MSVTMHISPRSAEDASGRASLSQNYHFIAEVVYLRANNVSIMHLWKVMIDIKWSTREGRRPHPRPTEVLTYSIE